MSVDEGYVKFRCEFIHASPVPVSAIDDLVRWRRRLYRLGLIGADADGIGYGNISKRYDGERFVISGTQTGGRAELSEREFTVVTGFDFAANSLVCEGPIAASSESLTHASVYANDPAVNVVIHVHHEIAWNRLRGRVPTTHDSAPYGTPEMAYEVRRLFGESDVRRRKFFVMGGHREGIVSFGVDADEAGELLLAQLSEFLTIPPHV